jgi:hypothetical protein
MKLLTAIQSIPILPFTLEKDNTYVQFQVSKPIDIYEYEKEDMDIIQDWPIEDTPNLQWVVTKTVILLEDARFILALNTVEMLELMHAGVLLAYPAFRYTYGQTTTTKKEKVAVVLLAAVVHLLYVDVVEADAKMQAHIVLDQAAPH